MPDLKGKVGYAQFLHDASEIPLNLRDWTSYQVSKEAGANVLTLELPIVQPNVTVPVIELFLK